MLYILYPTKQKHNFMHTSIMTVTVVIIYLLAITGCVTRMEEMDRFTWSLLTGATDNAVSTTTMVGLRRLCITAAATTIMCYFAENVSLAEPTYVVVVVVVYRMAQKNGATLSHCKYSENSITELRWNCNIMLNTVNNFLFKNFIALWRHLAKTQVLCDAEIYLYNVNKRQ